MKTKIAVWLYIVAAAILLMTAIGAVTRLSESGLSIVEWKPITGALPPLNDADWAHEFGLYKQSPQYIKMNEGMSLDAFKGIYFWEWFHRLFGRLIGIFYALPFFYFLAKREIPEGKSGPFWFILILGFLQGGMGWLMVKSGLVDVPAVSHYRLAAHLALAFLIYALLIRLALRVSVWPSEESVTLAPLDFLWRLCLFVFTATFIYGAFVAGLDAGLIYNEFPLMGKYPWPSELFDMTPVWRNFTENHAAVQFIHRAFAMVLAVLVFLLYHRAKAFHVSAKVRRYFNALLAVVLLQAGLGVATLMSVVDIRIATAHQVGAMVFLALLLRVGHEIPHKNYSRQIG